MRLNPLIEHHMRQVQHRLPQLACLFRINNHYYRPLPTSIVRIPIEQIAELSIELAERGTNVVLLDDLMHHPYATLHHRANPCEPSPSLFFRLFVP